MKILIIGDGNSIYIRNYIKNIFLSWDREIEIYLCTIRIRNAEYLKFYERNGIALIYCQVRGSLIQHIPIFKTLINFIYTLNKIQQNRYYDVIHVHFASFISCSLAFASRKLAKAEICSFWGSDLLRHRKWHTRLIMPFLDKCSAITLETQLMHDLLIARTKPNYENKIRKITFGIEGFEHIDYIIDHEDRNVSRQRLGIPLDKIVISIGYNGNPNHQHIRVLEQLKQLDDILLSRIFIILQMTYGNIDPEYHSEVKRKAENMSCQFKIFSDYMSNTDIARLRCATDIFVHAQTTDSFSSSFQEYIYASAIVLNAKWIKYKELESVGIKYIEYNSFDEIPFLIKDILVNIDRYRLEYSNNKQILKSFFSVSAVEKKWRGIYENLA